MHFVERKEKKKSIRRSIIPRLVHIHGKVYKARLCNSSGLNKVSWYRLPRTHAFKKKANGRVRVKMCWCSAAAAAAAAPCEKREKGALKFHNFLLVGCSGGFFFSRYYNFAMGYDRISSFFD